MDRYDRQILGILQEDATVPVADIGEQVGLTSTLAGGASRNWKKRA